MIAAPEKPKSSPHRLRVRTLIKLALLILVITILIPTLQILVPAIAYRDDLIALLKYTEGCESPCFMGIRFGVTTYDEAIEILKAEGWATEGNDAVITLEDSPSNDCYCNWEWSGNQPAMIDTTRWYGFSVRDGIVFRIGFSVRANFAAFVLHIDPDTGTRLIDNFQSSLSVQLPCAGNYFEYFNAQPSLFFSEKSADERWQPYQIPLLTGFQNTCDATG